MARLRAEPRNLFSWGFDLYADESLVTTMDMAWIREGGTFTWQGTEFTLTHEHLWSATFLLRTEDQTLARAAKTSPFLRRFDVYWNDRTLTLEAVSPFGRSFRLVENDSVLGTIVPDHPLARRCAVDFPDDLTIPMHVFLFWLAALMWRRAAHAGANP